MKVRGFAEYLGILLGPEALSQQFVKAEKKFRSRIHHIGALSLPPRAAVAAFHIFALSVLRYKLQFAAPAFAVRFERTAIDTH